MHNQHSLHQSPALVKYWQIIGVNAAIFNTPRSALPNPIAQAAYDANLAAVEAALAEAEAMMTHSDILPLDETLLEEVA